MKNTKGKFSVLATLALLSLVGMVMASCSGNPSGEKQISSFEECIAAGNPVMESNPRRCTADGKKFIESQMTSGKMPAEFTKEIETPKGNVFLTYNGNKTLLSGILERSVPCVDYQTDTIQTKDMPSSLVILNIFNKNKGVNCIQILGDPQEIMHEILSVSENTHYTVKFEDEEIYSGKLGDPQ